MAVPFQEKIRIIIRLLQNPQELSALLSLRHSGYLSDWGWFNAYNSHSSIGKNNEPLPWVAYPFIKFIEPRLNKNLSIFEYGSGNSTLYYSKFVKKITAAEHSREWFEKISAAVPSNAKVIYRPEDDNYAGSISSTDEKFDIIIVDAVKRVECIKEAVNFINDSGVIILDDSDREEYKEGSEFLLNKGFRSIEFWGISPGYLNNKSTTVFYKDNNCLKI